MYIFRCTIRTLQTDSSDVAVTAFRVRQLLRRKKDLFEGGRDKEIQNAPNYFS